MKRIIHCLLFVLASTIIANGQHEYILPSLKTIDQVSWKNNVYVFARFQTGQIIFDTGFESPQKHILNYNIFMERMDEITPSGDTIAFEKIDLPHTIRMGNYVFNFIPKKGYLRVLEPGKVSLATFDYFDAGYIQVISSGYSSSKSRVPLKVDDRKQRVELERSYIKKSELYFISDNELYHAIKLNLLKAYDKNRSVVKYYVEKQNVDFSDADSLAHLIRLLNGLNDTPENRISGLFRVKAGEPISKAWRDSLYLFPKFTDAIITPVSKPYNSPESLPMNYNLLKGKIEYINNAGDTVQLKTENVAAINFDNRLFYKQPAGDFAEQLMQGKVGLFEMKKLMVLRDDISQDASEGATVAFDKDVSRDRICVIESSYFLLDKNQFLSTANKGSFIRLFPKSRKKIDEYITTHPVDFEKRSDVLRLFSFCQQF